MRIANAIPVAGTPGRVAQSTLAICVAHRHNGYMPKRSSKKDVNQIAAEMVRETAAAGIDFNGKNPAAVALGRRGGLKGGKARAKALSGERRTEIARLAAMTRWKDNHGAEN